MDDIRLEKRTIQERLIIAKTLIETALSDLPTADLSEYCDKLWKTAYERGKAETRVIKLTEADKESLKKAMQDAELTLVAEPRKGKWVPHKVNAYTEWGSDCSECGEWFVVDRLVLGEKYHICPNCGAKMEE